VIFHIYLGNRNQLLFWYNPRYNVRIIR